MLLTLQGVDQAEKGRQVPCIIVVASWRVCGVDWIVINHISIPAKVAKPREGYQSYWVPTKGIMSCHNNNRTKNCRTFIAPPSTNGPFVDRRATIRTIGMPWQFRLCIFLSTDLHLDRDPSIFILHYVLRPTRWQSFLRTVTTILIIHSPSPVLCTQQYESQRPVHMMCSCHSSTRCACASAPYSSSLARPTYPPPTLDPFLLLLLLLTTTTVTAAGPDLLIL